jgi:hypothetical protein
MATGSDISEKWGTHSSDNNAMQLGRIYAFLASCVANSENKLNSIMKSLEKKDDVAQADLLALQAKIQSWGNLTSTATGILRAIGDSLKSTTQNIR